MFEYEQQDGEESTGMKQLRQALDKANAALKTRDEELTKLQGAVRTQSVREILRDRGINPKVAGLIPSDLDPTADAVDKWVKDYEDVFGAALRVEEKPKDSESEAEPATPAQSSVDAATQQALGRVQSAEASAGVVPPDIERAQLNALAAIGQEAGNNSQKLLSILQGRA
jgi:hypothetical protein